MTQLELPRRTSRKAYREILKTLGQRQMMVLELLRRDGPCTAMEIQDYVDREYEYEHPGLWKRFSELRNKGLIEECEKRPCKITGRTAIVWRVK